MIPKPKIRLHNRKCIEELVNVFGMPMCMFPQPSISNKFNEERDQ